MSLAASEVQRPSDVLRCVPYVRRITAEACVSSHAAALAGTKSCAKCLACADGARVRAALSSTPYAPELAEPDELEERATEPAPEPDEPEETVTMPLSEEEKKERHREYSRQYYLRQKEKARSGKAAPKPKRKAKAKRSASPAVPANRPLTEIATMLGIDVDGILGREIARVLGLS